MTLPKKKTANTRDIEIIKKDPQVRSFFRTLWSEDYYADFFFSHKENIFPCYKEPSMPMTFFPHLSNIYIPQDSSEHNDTVLNAISESKELVKEQMFPRNAMDGSEDEIASHIAATVILHLGRFLQKNPMIASEFANSEISYASILNVVKNRRSEINLDFFSEIKNNVESIWSNEAKPLVGDSAFNDVLVKAVDFFQSYLRDMINNGKPIFHSHQNEKNLISLCLAGYEKQDKLVQNYSKLLSNLYVRKFISNLTTIGWCSHCVDDPFITTSTSRLSPDQSKFNCPKCKRETCVASSFELIDPLREIILSFKDGMIGAAVTWLLAERHIKFEIGKYIGNFETDFLFEWHNKKFLLECKQHKRTRNTDGVTNNLIKDAKQTITALTELRKTGTSNVQAILLTNYKLDRELKTEIKQLQKSHKDIFTNDITIMDHKEFHTLINGENS